MNIPVAKRRHSTSSNQSAGNGTLRGDPQSPHSVVATGNTKQIRVLALKVDLDWRKEEHKKLDRQLRDLSRQEAYYRNTHILRRVAEARGWRVDPSAGDKTDISKQGRKQDKGNLSGAAYGACEREVAAVLTRDKQIYVGAPLPWWRPNSALTVRGHKNKAKSGVRLELENGQYIAQLQLLGKDAPGGCWVRLPIAKNTKRDEYQVDVLLGMVSWSIPILKAAVEIKRHKIILRLTWERSISLPAFGDRVATIAITRDGRFLVRTETQTKDCTNKLVELTEKKDKWDLDRRRAMRQIGRRAGHARIKRRVLARLSPENWVHTHIHTWTREIASWCSSQGVRTIRVADIGTGDWPRWKFEQLLTYKAAELGMEVSKDADLSESSVDRTVKADIGKRSRRVKRRAEAVRELAHQIGVTA